MDEEDNIYCPRLKKLRDECDVDGVTEHFSNYCKECSDLKLSHTSRKEKIFPNIKTPSWLLKKNESKKHETVEPTEIVQNRKTHSKAAAKKVTAKSSKEEIEETINNMNMQHGLTDAMLGWEIQRLRNISEVEARKEVIMLRKRKNEIPKKTVSGSSEPATKKLKQEPILCRAARKSLANERKNSKPWTPAVKSHFPQDTYSVLSNDDHKRLVSVYQSYINDGKYRFSANKEDVKQNDNKLNEERIKLNQRVVAEHYDPLNNTLFPKLEYMETYCKVRQAKRFEAIYGMRFYKEPIETISWDTTSSTPDDSKTAECYEISVQGLAERLRIPSLEDRLTLQTRNLTNRSSSQYQPNCANKFPIEEDAMALEICQEKGINIAMDASTACYLMTDSFFARPELCKFSISVKTRIYNGVLHKVAFISKPKYGQAQCNFVFLKMFSKYAFKNQYVEKRKKDNPTVALKLNEIDLKKTEGNNATEIEEPKSSNSSILNPIGYNPLDNILSAISSTSEESCKNTNKSGKRYSLFKIGGHKVLIRCSVPYLCHSDKIAQLNGKRVALETAIEWFPNIGATRLEQEELLYHYCKQVFKQAEALALVRIGIENKGIHNKPNVDVNVLQIHPMIFFTDPASADMENSMKAMFSKRCERLERLLTTVSTLEDGHFFLQKRSNSNKNILIISKELKDPEFESKENIIDFQVYTPVIRVNKHNPSHESFVEAFEGIDHRFMLQWQIYLNRIPGAFIACDSMLANEIERRRLIPPATGAAKKRRDRKAKAERLKGSPKKNTFENIPIGINQEEKTKNSELILPTISQLKEESQKYQSSEEDALEENSSLQISEE